MDAVTGGRAGDPRVSRRVASLAPALMRSAQRIDRLELWIVAAATPLLLFPSRWTPLGVAMILGTWICRRVARGALVPPTPANVPLLMLAGMAAVGLYASVDVTASVGAFCRIILGIAIFYALASGIRDERELHWMRLGLIAGGLGLSLLTLFGTQWQAVRLIDAPGLYRALPPLLRDPLDSQSFHPRVMGMGLATMLPVVLSLALSAESRDRITRVCAAMVGPLMVVALALTQAVQAFLGLGVALLFIAVWRYRWLAVGAAGASGLVGFGLMRDSLQPLALRWLSVNDPLGIALVLRTDMWGRAIAMLKDMPFSGIGLDTYPRVQIEFYPGFLLGPEPHAHNLVLQVALDLGVPGLIAFCWLLVAVGTMLFRAYRLSPGGDRRALVVGLAAGLIGYLATGVLDTLWSAKVGVLLWVLLGASAATYGSALALAAPAASAARPAASTIRHRIRRTSGWLAFPVLLSLALLALPGLRERNLGVLQAHQAIFQARTGRPQEAALEAARLHLEQAQAWNAVDSHVYSLLGSLAAWQGDYEAASQAFKAQVALDVRDPIWSYAPFEELRRWVAGEPATRPAADLLSVYAQWMTRFPGRAEPYVWSAIVRAAYLDEPAEAANVLRAALDAGAQPESLVRYQLSHLGGGGNADPGTR